MLKKTIIIIGALAVATSCAKKDGQEGEARSAYKPKSASMAGDDRARSEQKIRSCPSAEMQRSTPESPRRRPCSRH